MSCTSSTFPARLLSPRRKSWQMSLSRAPPLPRGARSAEPCPAAARVSSDPASWVYPQPEARNVRAGPAALPQARDRGRRVSATTSRNCWTSIGFAKAGTGPRPRSRSIRPVVASALRITTGVPLNDGSAFSRLMTSPPRCRGGGGRGARSSGRCTGPRDRCRGGPARGDEVDVAPVVEHVLDELDVREVVLDVQHHGAGSRAWRCRGEHDRRLLLEVRVTLGRGPP